MKQNQSRERFAKLIGETHRVWRIRMNERLRPLGLSQARWMTLRALSRGGDAMPQMELAALVGIEPPTLVRILDGLVTSGFVQRRVSALDRRIKTVHLTSKAQRKLEEIEAVAHALRTEVTQHLDAATLAAAVAALETVRNRLLSMAAEPQPRAVAKASKKQALLAKSSRSTAGRQP